MQVFGACWLRGRARGQQRLRLPGHSTAQAQHQVKRALLLDVVVGQSAAVLQLLAGKDQALLVGGDAFLVLDLGLDGVDGVGRLDFQSDGLAGEGLHENLHFL